MNVSMKTIYVELPAAEAATAAVAEGAIDLPQGTACQRVIGCDGRVAQITPEAVKGAVALEGLVEYAVLFEDGDGKPDSITGVCPFAHKLAAPQAEPGMDVKVKCAVSSPAARAAGPSRLLVSAVVEIQAEVYGIQGVSVVQGGEDDKLQTLRQRLFWHSRGAAGKGSYTLREEVEVPAPLPEIAKVLSARGSLHFSDVQALNGEAMVAGDLNLSVLYADAGGAVNRHTLSVPFGAPVVVAGMTERMEARAWGSASQFFINVGENLSDERRVLTLEAPLFLNVEGYESTEMEALADAYHLERELGLAREDIGLYDGPVEVSEKVKVKGALPPTDISCDMLPVAEVTPVIDNHSASEGTVEIGGRLAARLFGTGEDGKLYSWLADAPFTATVQWEGASSDSAMEISAAAVRATASPGPSGPEVEAELDVTITSRRLLRYRVLTALEPGAEYTAPPAPLTLCVAGSGDTAWTIAKRCRVKEEDLLKTNPEIAKGLEPGAKIVVFRK